MPYHFSEKRGCFVLKKKRKGGDFVDDGCRIQLPCLLVLIRVSSVSLLAPLLLPLSLSLPVFCSQTKDVGVLLVQGPPGVGKSATIAAFCLSHSSCGKKILLISRNFKRGLMSAMLFQEGQILAWKETFGPKRTADIIHKMSLQPNLVVVDGLVGEDMIDVFTVVGSSREYVSILCTSQQFPGKMDDIKLVFLTYCSWRWEMDYVPAMRDVRFRRMLQEKNFFTDPIILGGDVLENDDNGDVTESAAISYLERKYFYGGGSSRFVFFFSAEEVVTKTANLMDRIRVDSVRSPNFLSDINTLQQRCRLDQNKLSEPMIVSKYFAMEALEKIGNSAFESILSGLIMVRCANPSVVGFLFEAQCLWTITTRKKIFLQNLMSLPAAQGHRNIVDLELIVSDRYDFPPPSGINLQTISRNVLLVPEKWNNACFDWAMLVDENEMDELSDLSSREVLEESAQRLRDIESPPGTTTRAEKKRRIIPSQDEIIGTSTYSNEFRFLSFVFCSLMRDNSFSFLLKVFSYVHFPLLD